MAPRAPRAAWFLAACSLLTSAAGSQSKSPNLTVRAALVDGHLNQKPVPLLQFRLEPAAGGAPLSAVTNFRGRAVLQVPKGAYTLITPHPVPFDGLNYHWQLSIAVTGVPQEIDLSNVNAATAPVPAAPAAPKPPSRASLRGQFQRLRPSVVTVWSAMGRGSGFLVDSRGLILTNDHVVADTRYLAVQFDPQHKVTASVLAADPDRDVAVLQVNPATVGGRPPLPLAAASALAAVQPGDAVFAIGSPLDQRRILTSGIISSVEPDAFISGININHGNSGGPLLDAQGEVIGITTFLDPGSPNVPGVSGIIKISQALSSVEHAQAALPSDAAPSPAPLPVTPSVPFPLEALKSAARIQHFDVKPYQFHQGGFDVLIATPVLTEWLSTRGARALDAARARRTQRGTGPMFDPAADLRNWMQYTGEFAPTVEIEATPQLRATFLSRFARAYDHGLTSLKMRFRADFERMDLRCGGKLIAPIQPGRIPAVANFAFAAAQGLDAAFEGLYVYGPNAFDPHCRRMALTLYSASGHAVSKKNLDPKLVRRIWQSFAPWRAAAALAAGH